MCPRSRDSRKKGKASLQEYVLRQTRYYEIRLISVARFTVFWWLALSRRWLSGVECWWERRHSILVALLDEKILRELHSFVGAKYRYVSHEGPRFWVLALVRWLASAGVSFARYKIVGCWWVLRVISQIHTAVVLVYRSERFGGSLYRRKQ